MSVFLVLPGSWSEARQEFREPGGRPGPRPRECRRVGRQHGRHSNRTKTPPDPRRRQPTRPDGLAFPRTPQVFDKVTSQTELGVGHQHQPRPAIRRPRVTKTWLGPAQRLLEKPESMFHVETTQEHLPQPVRLARAGRGIAAGRGVPQSNPNLRATEADQVGRDRRSQYHAAPSTTG